jgi:hypothetical protein
MGLLIVIALAAIAVWFLLRTRHGEGYESSGPRAFRRPERYDEPPAAPTTQPVITDRRSAELDRQLDEWEAEQRRQRDSDK